jgi:type IV pilus biogenesis protein PilP
MRNDWCIVLLIGAALCASSARAGSTADDLAQIEAEHAVLKARLRVLETRAQMAARQAEIDRHVPAAGRSTAPSVSSIEGVSGKLRATVLLDNGQVAEVVEGDTLPNGQRVLSIQSDGVVVQGPDKKRVRLKPAGDAGSRDPAFTVATEGGTPPADKLPVPAMPPVSARPGPAR